MITLILGKLFLTTCFKFKILSKVLLETIQITFSFQRLSSVNEDEMNKLNMSLFTSKFSFFNIMPVNYNRSYRSSHTRCSLKKVLLKISQNSQENSCVWVPFFNKVPGLKPATLLKRDSGTGVFLLILYNF